MYLEISRKNKEKKRSRLLYYRKILEKKKAGGKGERKHCQ